MTDTQTPEVQDLSIVVVAENNFNTALQELQIKKENLIAQKDECLAMKITDKESAKAVDERRKLEKKKRIILSDRAKELREDYQKANKKIIELEKEYKGIIEEGENYLGEIHTAYTVEQDRIKKEQEKKEMMRYTMRCQQLSNLGVLVGEDGKFRLDEIVRDVDLIKTVDDDIFEETILSPFKEVFEKHEAERLEKERIEQERQAIWTRQKAEIEEQRKAFAEEKRLFEEQQQKRKEAESQARKLQLLGIGLKQSFDSGYFIDEAGCEYEISVMEHDEATWSDLVKTLSIQVTERKAAAEKEKERKRLEAEQRESRQKEILSIGFMFIGQKIIGYSKEYPIEKLQAPTNEIFNSFLELLRQDKMEFENAEKEKLRQQIIEEEKRNLELERIRKEQELAEATDKQKWEHFLSQVAALANNLPEVTNRRYRKAIGISKEKLEEITEIKPHNFYQGPERANKQ